MISRRDILDGLNLLVLEAFPTHMVYRDMLPDQFERPSALIALDKRTVKDGSDGTVEVSQPFRVQVIAARDSQGLVDTDTLQQDADIAEQLLWRGYLSCSGRCLHIESIGAEREPEDAIRIYGTLHYFDDRPDTLDDAPAATEVFTNLMIKENQ